MFRPRNAAIFGELQYLRTRCVLWPKHVGASRLCTVTLVGNKFVYIMTKLTESSEQILRIHRHLKVWTMWSRAFRMHGTSYYRVTPQNSLSCWSKTFWPIEGRWGELAPGLYRMHINVVSLSPNYTIALRQHYISRTSVLRNKLCTLITRWQSLRCRSFVIKILGPSRRSLRKESLLINFGINFKF